jgi:hypothetical protein
VYHPVHQQIEYTPEKVRDDQLKSLLGKHKEKAEDEARQSKSVFEPRHRGRVDASP